MKKYSVSFLLYGGFRIVPVEAENEKEAIEKAKKENSHLPVRFNRCVEIKG